MMSNQEEAIWGKLFTVLQVYTIESKLLHYVRFQATFGCEAKEAKEKLVYVVHIETTMLRRARRPFCIRRSGLKFTNGTTPLWLFLLRSTSSFDITPHPPFPMLKVYFPLFSVDIFQGRQPCTRVTFKPPPYTTYQYKGRGKKSKPCWICV